jgi:hypothetical protein
MRFNMFLQKNGTGYGSLVCAVCNKNVSFEIEQQTDLSAYGEGSRLLNMLGAPKPPNVERRKANADAALNDQTL